METPSQEMLIQQLHDRMEKLERIQQTAPENHFPTSGIVSKKFLCRYFKISKNTLARWEMLGLKMVRLGTRSGYYFCTDVLTLLQEFQAKELPKYKSKMLQELEARRAAKPPTKG